MKWLSYNAKRLENPSQKELRAMALELKDVVFQTKYGNLNRITRNKARMNKYTYVLAPESEKEKYSQQVLDPEKGKELIERQKEYIEKKGELIEIQGYEGLGEKAVPVQWLYTREGANIAGMQQILAFPREMIESKEQLEKPFQPTFRVVYTPDFFVDDMPGRQAILVDLEDWATYIMGPDYFGESKKAALRMLNQYVYERGGLVLHAGAKAVKVGDKLLTVTIMGLSGTGKTTTTFSKQGELTQPIQDDMVALWPGGECTITENGCFAKTFGLTEESEPVIYRGTIKPSAWVENVFMTEDGDLDFSKKVLTPEDVKRYRQTFIATGEKEENLDAYISGRVKAEEVLNEFGVPKDGWDFVVWTENGRSIIPMSEIENAADLHNIPPVKSMGILNRDEGPDAATPGIVKFKNPDQAAGYFMLGETSKTSAAGKDRGKTRSPFTQPFFPSAHGLQAERFSELLKTMEGVDTWMMNTGYVGGDAKDVEAGKALKVKIRHSSTMLEFMFAQKIKWVEDPDFGYLVVDVEAPENKELLQIVPKEILQPRLFYESQGRMEEYRNWVERMKKERKEFLEKYHVAKPILAATVQV
ncbi:MAG: phosphoenolpyruvate carboxykinase (ATP) [Planctomycetota bacterium]|nr:MAG: phosphoenolpyruvate carboxykinase (ATP) [Planctomycetota bacterium]